MDELISKMEKDDCNDKIIVVSSDNVEFTGRRTILLNESDYFKALYSSGMRDSKASKISLPCLHSEGLNFVLPFLEGKQKESISMDIISNVLNAASYLQIQRVIELSVNFLKTSLNAQNYMMIKELAEDFQLNDLCLFVDKFVCGNFNDIIQEDPFLEIPHGFLSSLLNKDEVSVESEAVLFSAALRWIKCQKDSVMDSVDDILSGVRFPLMTKSELEQCKACLNSMGVDSSLRAYEQIDVALEHIENPTLVLDKEGKVSNNYQARCTSPVLLSLGGFTQSDQSTNRMMIMSTQELTDSERVSWMIHPPSKDCLKLPKTLCEHCVVSLGPFVFVAGGQTKYCQDGRHTQKNMYRLDTRNGMWTEVSSMRTPRSLFYMGLLEGLIYAVGGWIGPNRVSKGVERYNPQEDSWQHMAPLEIHLHEHAGTEHGGKLYVSGGFKGPYRGHLNRVWSYDPGLDRWEERASMIYSRSYHAMVATHSHLLVAGGVNYIGNDLFQDVLDCEQYDPETNEWTIITQVPRYASCMSSCLLNGSLYMFGGHSFAGDADHHQIQIYDIDSGQWTQKEMLTKNAKFFVGLVVMLPKRIQDCFKKIQ